MVSRLFAYSWKFYLKRIKIVTVFSSLFLLASLVPFLVSLPTYMTLGGVYVRTQSIPELSFFDIVFTSVVYLISLFIISEAIVNINLIIKSKRTWTHTTSEIKKGITKYATKIFLIMIILQLLVLSIQLLLFENSLKTYLYPLLTGALAFLFFFIAPAIVIDESSTLGGIVRSSRLAIRKPVLVLLWALLGFVILSLVKTLLDFIFTDFAQYDVLLVNSLLVVPYLIILQTQMYMEKYPLAK